jgi:histone deacetylase 6
VGWNGCGVGDDAYLAAVDSLVLPIARQYDPDLVIVAAGFDSARGDPLGRCDVTPKGYATIVQRLRSLAGGRIVVALEGGYLVRNIAHACQAILAHLIDPDAPIQDVADLPDDAEDRADLDEDTRAKFSYPLFPDRSDAVDPDPFAAIALTRQALQPFWPEALPS